MNGGTSEEPREADEDLLILSDAPCLSPYPACDAWLLGYSEEEPNHLCEPVASESVRNFAEVMAERRTPRRRSRSSVWHVLPVTSSAIADYRIRMTAVQRRLRRAFRATVGTAEVELPDADLPGRLFDHPRALWAGCVISQFSDGVSHTERSYFTDFSQGGMSRKHGRTWSHVLVVGELLPDDRRGRELPHSVALTDTFVLVEGPMWEDLVDATREAERWARRVLLGHSTGRRSRGRPRGTGEFQTRQEFVSACRQAAGLLGFDPTLLKQEALAIALGDVRGIKVVRETFRYWRKTFGFPSWADLKAHLQVRGLRR